MLKIRDKTIDKIFDARRIEFLKVIGFQKTNRRKSLTALTKQVYLGSITGSKVLKDFELLGLVTHVKTGRCVHVTLAEKGEKVLELITQIEEILL